MKKVLVTGGTGFIGLHLIRRLKQDGYWVRCVDIEEPRYALDESDEFLQLDLRNERNSMIAAMGMEWVFHLAATMGGIGFISTAHAEIIQDNTLININMIEAARRNNIKKFLFSSSACVYPCYLQESADPPLLKESDVYPADPQGRYGWEKLHMEHLCQAYREAEWLDTKVVRFHNVAGPEGTWRGGREKVVAALCRKTAIAKLSGNPEVEIWGDGSQARSYLYIDDCVEGLLRLMRSDFPRPMNLGRDRAITVDELADLTADAAGVEIVKKYVPGPEGVKGRNSDNSLCRKVLRWEPQMEIEAWIGIVYKWVEGHVLGHWDELKPSATQ